MTITLDRHLLPITLMTAVACAKQERLHTIEHYEAVAPTSRHDSFMQDLVELARSETTYIDDPEGHIRPTNDYHYVGAIVRLDANTGEIRVHCTATALDKRLILTAAHCVWDLDKHLRIDQSSDEFYFVIETNAYDGALTHRLVAPIGPDTYDRDTILDLGLASLSTPIAEAVFPVLATRLQAKDGTILKLGYGWWTDANNATGPLRRIGLRTPALMTMHELSNDGLRFDYTPYDPPKSAICNGDSGGPAFVTEDGTHLAIVGVTHGSLDPDAACHQGGIDTSIPGGGATWINQWREQHVD